MTTTSQDTTSDLDVVRVADYVRHSAGIRLARVVLQVATTQAIEVVDLTDHIAAAVRATALRTGWVDLACRHTSCGLVLNENETGLRNDMRTLSRELVEGHPHRLWQHDNLAIRTENLVDGERPNAHSHLLTMLFTAPYLRLQIEDTRLDLGRWQRVLLAEFDGPRPDPGTQPGQPPTHPIRQVVLNVYGTDSHTGGEHPNGNGARR